MNEPMEVSGPAGFSFTRSARSIHFRKSIAALLIGFCSAGVGLWLAWPDALSVGFVIGAGVAYGFFMWFLADFEMRSAPAAVRQLSAKREVEDWPSEFDRLKRLVAPELTPRTGPSRRRRILLSEFLGADAALLPDGMHPGAWLSAGQAVLVSIGLFGTFFGLSTGLKTSMPYIDAGDGQHAGVLANQFSQLPAAERESAAMQVGMSKLLGGARTAFSKSVAGIGLGLSYMLLWRVSLQRQRERARAVAEHFDDYYPYVSAEDLLGERVDAITQQLLLLRATQPDGNVLTAAAESLGRGATALQAAGSELGVVAKGLTSFSADTLAAQVSIGVQSAVRDELKPTMDSIRDELRKLHEDKRAQDEVVERQLKLLVDDLREHVLDPMAKAIRGTNSEVARVAGTVTELGSVVLKSATAVEASSLQMTLLTDNLTTFERESLGRLETFADGLSTTLGDFTRDSSVSFQQMGTDIRESVDTAAGAMESQRTAFEASAEKAGRAFETQAAAVERSGDAAADAIRTAGTEASKTLIEVRDGFAASLVTERTALEATLHALNATFEQDLRQRGEFERRAHDSLLAIGEAAETAMAKQSDIYDAASQRSSKLFKDRERELRETGLIVTDSIREAGVQCSRAIEASGGKSAQLLDTVGNAATEQLRLQAVELADVLAHLQQAFAQDSQARSQFDDRTASAIKAVQQLVSSTAITDTVLRETTVEAAKELGRQVYQLGKTISIQSQELQTFKESLGTYLADSAAAHRDFMAKEDAHLRDVLGRIYGLVEELLAVSTALNERSAGGVSRVK